MNGPQKKRTPWFEKTRAQRKRRYIRAKNKIRESRRFFRNIYHTSDALVPGCGWADLIFLSRRYPGSYYNVTIETAQCAFFEALQDRVWEQMIEGAGGYSAYRRLGPELHAKAMAARVELSALLAADPSMAVFEQAQIDLSYQAGIGLHVTIDAPYISPEAVERFILSFWADGELPFRGSTPMSWPSGACSNSFAIPVGVDPGEWAQDLLIRNQALEQSELLALELPAAPPSPPSPRSL